MLRPGGPTQPHVVVVGAGIAGLTAAYTLMRSGRVRVTVLESAPRTGGKLRRGEVAGHATDLGAEAVLARRPEGIELHGRARPVDGVAGDHGGVGVVDEGGSGRSPPGM